MNRLARLLLVTGLLACCAGIVMAEELEQRIAALEEQNRRLEQSVDELERERAAEDPLKLTQELQWGKSWGADLSTGLQGQASTVELGILSPRIANLLSFEARGAWVKPNSYPKEANGVQANVRVILSTPMLFSFSRVYGGVEGVGTWVWWDWSDYEGAAMDYFKLATYSAMLFGGMEMYTSPWSAMFLEVGRVVPYATVAYGSGLWDPTGRDAYDFNHDFYLKAGARFYLPR